MDNEFHIGQVFEGEFPREAAYWCNENECAIDEIDPLDDGTGRFEIRSAPSVVTAVVDRAPTRDELADAVAEIGDMVASQDATNEMILDALAELGDAVAELAERGA